jgi:hypothetical protein
MHKDIFKVILSFFVGRDAVDPWYSWMCGSTETAIEETLRMLTVHSAQCCTTDA